MSTENQTVFAYLALLSQVAAHGTDEQADHLLETGEFPALVCTLDAEPDHDPLMPQQSWLDRCIELSPYER